MVVSDYLFYFCGVPCNFFFFISNLIDLSQLPFFSWRVCLNVYQFCVIFSKSQLLVSLIFAIVCFISVLFISALIFMIYFLLFLGLFVFLSLALGVRLGCLFVIFLVS